MTLSGIARKKRLSFRLHAVFPQERELMEHLQQLRNRQAAPVLMQFILRAFESQCRGERLPEVEQNWPWLDNPMLDPEDMTLSQRFALGFQNPSEREAVLLNALDGLTDDRRAEVLRSLALRGFVMDQMAQNFWRGVPSNPGPMLGVPLVQREQEAVEPIGQRVQVVPLRQPTQTAVRLKPKIQRENPPAKLATEKKQVRLPKAQTESVVAQATKPPEKAEPFVGHRTSADSSAAGGIERLTSESIYQTTAPLLENSDAMDAVEIPDSIPEAISSGDGIGESVQIIQPTSQVEVITVEPMAGRRNKALPPGLQGLMGVIVGGPAGE